MSCAFLFKKKYHVLVSLTCFNFRHQTPKRRLNVAFCLIVFFFFFFFENGVPVTFYPRFTDLTLQKYASNLLLDTKSFIS